MKIVWRKEDAQGGMQVVGEGLMGCVISKIEGDGFECRSGQNRGTSCPTIPEMDVLSISPLVLSLLLRNHIHPLKALPHHLHPSLSCASLPLRE